LAMFQDLKIIALVTSLGRIKRRIGVERMGGGAGEARIDHVVFLRSVADVLAPHEEAAAATSYKRYLVPSFVISFI